MGFWTEGPCGHSDRRRYLLEALLDPLVPVAEHVQPFDLPLPGHLHPQILLTVSEEEGGKEEEEEEKEEKEKEEKTP